MSDISHHEDVIEDSFYDVSVYYANKQKFKWVATICSKNKYPISHYRVLEAAFLLQNQKQPITVSAVTKLIPATFSFPMDLISSRTVNNALNRFCADGLLERLRENVGRSCQYQLIFLNSISN